VIGDQALPAPEPPAATAALLSLQRMESALVRAEMADPGLVAPDILRRVRYVLRFAHLTAIPTGAGETISVEDELATFRTQVLETLHSALRDDPGSRDRLLRAHAALGTLAPALEEARAALLHRHAGELGGAELDAELASKALVSVAGGGGGAGYVYIGAYQRMHEAGLVPDYVLGASIGAIMGLFVARRRQADWTEYLTLARTLTGRELFGPPRRQRRYGLPGLVQLRLESTFGALFSSPTDGAPYRISDLEIPYEAIVGGVRRRSFDRLPVRFRRPPGAAAGADAGPGAREPRLLARARLGAAGASRMWQVAAFFDPRVVKAVSLGGDELTRSLRAIDAAGFSASIPGVLHYDVTEPDPETERVLDTVLEREDVSALVDGGVTANVPAAFAWERVQAGAIGTRNAFVLAFDCFHPQWDPRHLWLQPITQAVALQRARDVRYADWVLRFEPTLSPVTLVPSPETVDQAIGWGRAAIEPLLPMLERSLEPVWWETPPPPTSDRLRFWRRR
jgi:predicted acylesterase/phospholipase RssA